ncbi:MAG: hypothetical protein IJF40_03565 [Clostridia bacterium]|nr:hypothetical protein [Clostridia bacterium]
MKRLTSFFLISAVAIMMVCYLTCDIFSIWDSRPLKFATSAVIVLFGLTVINKKESRFVSIGFIFTLAADVFLVLLDKYLYGVSLFILAQLTYTVHFAFLSGKTVWKELLKRIVPAAAAGIAVFAFGLGANIALPAAYAVCIGVNIAHAIELQHFKPCKNHLMLLFGFILFVCGDICVGLRHLPPDIITQNVSSVLYLITWATYPPSQILILLSTNSLKYKK